jgi:hypothetical protein
VANLLGEECWLASFSSEMHLSGAGTAANTFERESLTGIGSDYGCEPALGTDEYVLTPQLKVRSNHSRLTNDGDHIRDWDWLLCYIYYDTQ